MTTEAKKVLVIGSGPIIIGQAAEVRMPRQHCTGGCECGAGAYEVDADLNRTVTGNRIGGEFVEDRAFDKELGFYLRP